MSQELVCITCPMGCHLTVENLPGGELQVSGNRCPRGAVYAREETLAPKRVVTATCSLGRPCAGASCADASTSGHESLSAPRRVPCRTTAAFPKEGIDALIAALYALEVPLPVKRGDVILPNALGTGIDVIATRSIE
jgi:CxxC motif-containing protein